MEKSKRCENCFYYAEFEGVCCCADSDECADFTDKDFSCEYHQERAEMQDQGLFGEE